MILSALGGPIVKAIADSLFGSVASTFEAYFNKQISETEARARVQQSLLSAFSQVERSHADALAKTYASFMDALKTAPMLQKVWATVMISQLAVLIWYQWAVPFMDTFFGVKYASAGATVDWSYLIIAAGIGVAPVMLRAGPGASSVADRIKSIGGQK